jgi:glycosyltransferase involved in cell wall biosynthesis
MIITHLNFAKGFRGGERQTQLLIKELSKEGFKQQLFVRKNSQLIKRCQNIKNLSIREISKPYFLHLSKVKNSSILHAHETKAAQFAFFAHLLFKIPYIVTRRVDNPIKNNFLNKLIYEKATKVIALSNAIKKTVTDITNKANIEIIPSAYIDKQPNKQNIEAIKNKYKNKFLVGHVGALDEKHKGQSVIINLAKKVQNDYPDIHFLLIGDGKDKEILQNMAKDLKNITFVGFVENVVDYIAALDLFLFPSRNEGLGSTLLDVLHVNIPILASNVGGIPEIIQDGYNGILFDIHNPHEIEEKFLNLFLNNDLREIIKNNSKKYAKNYAPEMMAQRYITIYQNIISKEV